MFSMLWFCNGLTQLFDDIRCLLFASQGTPEGMSDSVVKKACGVQTMTRGLWIMQVSILHKHQMYSVRWYCVVTLLALPVRGLRIVGTSGYDATPSPPPCCSCCACGYVLLYRFEFVGCCGWACSCCTCARSEAKCVCMWTPPPSPWAACMVCLKATMS